MAYRDEEAALRSRQQLLRQSRDHKQEEVEQLRVELSRTRTDVSALRTRLAEAGPGSGARGWRKDRVDVAAWGMVLVGALAAMMHVEWNQYVSRDPSVIPAIIWLGVPGLLAALVAAPYAKVSGRCAVAVIVGGVIAVLPFVNLVLGWSR